MTRAQHSARTTLLTTIQTVAIVIQTIAVVIGVIFALSQLQQIKEQNKQAKTIASAQLTVDLDKIFDTKKYDDIAIALDDKPETKVRAKFGAVNLEGYLGWLETIGVLLHENILICDMVYNEFSYNIIKAYENHDIQKLIKEDQKNNPTTWEEFQSMGKSFSKGNPCKEGKL